MGVDRILQLKLVADVGDVNAKMGGVEGTIGRVGGAIKSWGVAVALDKAIELVGGLNDRVWGGVEAAREAEAIWSQLENTWTNLDLGPLEELDRLASDIGSRALSLGFDDDSSLAQWREFLQLTGDADEATRLLTETWNLARSSGDGLETSATKVRGAFLGMSRTLNEFGVGGQGLEGMEAVEAAFGGIAGAADEHMTTAEGRMERFNGRIDEIFEAIGGVILGFTEPFLDLMDELDPVLATIQEQVGPAFTALGEATGPVIDTLVTNLGKLFDVGVKLWPMIEQGIALVSPLIEGFGELVGGVFNGITDLLDAVIALLEGDFQGAWESAVKFVESVWGGIVGAVKGPINMVLGAIEAGLNFLGDAFFGALEEIRGHLNNVAFVGDQVPDDPIRWGGISVPRLAAGGIVTGPTLALIGEAGREAVIPLDRGGGMGGNTYHIHLGVVTDPAAAGRQIVEAIQAHERRSGAAWRAA